MEGLRMRKTQLIMLVILMVLTGSFSACAAAPVTPTSETAPPIASEVTETSTPEPSITPTHEVELNWWNEAVFYEIFVRSFADSNGDGNGDINGLTAHLDYLNDGNPDTNTDLGVTALWLMPIQASDTYHGYDVTDYYTINPDYGTMDDFRLFIDEAHAHGMRVIIDLVLNHTSSNHPWFQAAQDPASPYREYYIWSETDPGYEGPWGQQVWFPGANGGFYYAVFGSNMPDLNLQNPEVTAALQDVARFWLEDVGVDGFRLDAAKHMIEDGTVQTNTTATHEWWAAFRDFVKSINPDAFLVGEVWDSSDTIATYLTGNELDMAFNFDLADFMVSAAASRIGVELPAAFQAQLPYFEDGFDMGTFLRNHDMARTMVAFGGDPEKAKSAATILLTAPGTPFIYYGEEIGMTGDKPDENIRTPMQWDDSNNAGFTAGTPWEAVNADFTTINVAAQTNDPTSLLSHYRTLISLRNQYSALQTGAYFSVETANRRVYSVLRVEGDQAILVVINLANTETTDYALSLASSSLQGEYQVTSLLGSGGFVNLVCDELGGFTGYIPIPNLPANGNYILLLERVP
jgi:glycosidase